MRRALLFPGSMTPAMMWQRYSEVDMIVAGEVREWENTHYAADIFTAGEKRALVTIGRAVSEDPGMRACAEWVKTIVKEVPAKWIGGRPVLETGLMTAREVVELIKKNATAPWNERSTRDTFKAGNPDVTVKGIATTMMVTFDMLKRANAAGLNMVITHEDTFWNDHDDTQDLAANHLYQLKTDYILKNNMVVWRDHDNMHASTPDYTVLGELRSAGLSASVPGGPEHVSMRPGILTIPETTLGELAAEVKRSSGAQAIRCVGDPKAKVRKILIGPGYATPRMTPDVDVVIGGEQQEADGGFDNVEYVMDAVSLGMAKGVIMLGHVSEQAGMEDFGNWPRTFIKDIPIRFVPAEEPYW
jgi:putative NIF3 family GTP cyclohydrolase 1 type 2